MADESTILKEYLISIGVSADIDTISKFKALLGSVEKIAVSMTTAMAAGVVAIEGLVYATTSNLDDLYWASKRLKSSAADIQDFQLRMEKAGDTAADARQILETISMFRRTNPLGDQVFGLMGIKAEGKGTVEVVNQLADAFKRMKAQGKFGEAMAFAQGQQLFGLSPAQISSMMQTVKVEDLYARMYKRLGINQQQALEDSHRYTNELKDLKAEFNVVSQELGLKFLPVADKVLKWLMQSDAAHEMGGALLKIAGDVAEFGGTAAKLFNEMPKDAQELGIVGFLLFGRKGLAIGILMGEAAALLDKLSGDTGKGRPEKVQEAGESRRFDRVAARWNYDHGLGWMNSKDFNATYEEYKKKKAEADQKKVAIQKLLPKQDQYDEGFGVGAGQPGDKGFKSKDASQWLFTGDVGPAIAIEKTLSHEDATLSGRVTRDSNGLMTKYGLNKNDHLPVKDVKDLTLAQARAVYRTEYWDKLAKRVKGFDKMSQPVKESAFDAAVNQGLENAVKWLKASGNDLTRFNQLRTQQYQGLAKAKPEKFAQFLEGWLSRLGAASAAVPGRGTGAAATGAPKPSGRGGGFKPGDLGAVVVTPQVLMAAPPTGAAATGNRSLSVSQTTNVTIHGAKDPDRTAAQTKKALDRSNGDLVRNFSPALQ